MKSKDLIAMGIIAAAALSINGMTASADEVSADTSYEAAAPSYSDSGSSCSSSSTSGGSGSGSGASSSSSSSASSGSAGSSSSGSSSGSTGSSSSGSSSDSAGSGSSSTPSGSSGSSSSGTNSSSNSSAAPSIASESGSSSASASGGLNSAAKGLNADNSNSADIHTNSSDTGDNSSEEASDSSHSTEVYADSEDIQSDANRSNENSSAENSNNAGSSKSTNSTSSSNGKSAYIDSDADKNSTEEPEKSAVVTTNTDFVEGNSNSTDADMAMGTADADVNSTNTDTTAMGTALYEDSKETLDPSSEMKQSFALSDILGAELLGASSEEYLESVEKEIQEPDQDKSYSSEAGTFVYKDGSWWRTYEQPPRGEVSEKLEDFQILDEDQCIYSYVVEEDYGKEDKYKDTYIVGISEETENVTWIVDSIGINTGWYVYRGDVYRDGRKYDSMHLSGNIYRVDTSVETIIGWTENDIKWQDPYKTLFLYNEDLFVTDPDYIEAYKMHVEKRSEDGHIIWFTDPNVTGYDPFPDHLRMTGWNDADVTWINKELGLFQLNGTDEYYLAYDELIAERYRGESATLYFGSAYLLEDAELLDGKPIVKFTWTGIPFGSKETATEERIVGWTLENVDYTVKVNHTRLLNVGDTWYAYAGEDDWWGFDDYDDYLEYAGFAQAIKADVSSDSVSNGVVRLTWNESTYLTGIPENVKWIVSEGENKGLFEYDGDMYLTGLDDSGLAVQAKKVEKTDGVVLVDDKYLLNWKDKASPSPDNTFFYNGSWYQTEDQNIGVKINPSNTKKEENFSENVKDSKYIVYDAEKGWIIQYDDGAVSPVEYVYSVSALSNSFIAERSGTAMIVGCQDSQFLSLCDKLYYGKDGLEAFEYNGSWYPRNTYAVSSTSNIAIEVDSEDNYLSADEDNKIVEIDKKNNLIWIDGFSKQIDTEKSTDKYIAFYDNAYDLTTGAYDLYIYNWPLEGVTSITEDSFDKEGYGFYSYYYDYSTYESKGEYPYIEALYFKLDGYWYSVSFVNNPVSDSQIKSMTGLIATRLSEEEYFDANGVMYDEDNNKIIGVNNITSGIRWIQSSDFKYYDTTNTGVDHKIPAWFEYKGKYYVTYDGCSAYQIRLFDSKEKVYYLENDGAIWFYSDWNANKNVTWLSRSDDGHQHVTGWFIYDGKYYYTKDGRSAKIYEQDSLNNVWDTSRYFWVGTNNADLTDWQNSFRRIGGMNSSNNYHSTKAVEYAKEHVSDPVGVNNDDCANYVSQCLSAGGLVNTDQWKPESDAWILVEEQMKYLQNYGNLTRVNQEKPDIQIGNPVYYDFNGDGRYDHVAICVGYDEETGKPIVYDHSSSKRIKKFDELETDAIATIFLPNLDAKNDTSALILREVSSQGAGYRTEFNMPKQYLINWDVSKADYYLFGDRYRQAGSKKGIFTYRGYWYLCEDGQTALNCGPVRLNKDENEIIRSTLLLALTGEKPIYLTDSENPDVSLSVYIDDDLDIQISNVGTKSYYLDTSDSSSKTWRELTDGIHIQKYDSDQINAIFTLNGKTYITFDGLTAYPLSNIEWKKENGLFNRFTIAAKRQGNDSVYISEWDADKADFDTYLNEGGKITFRLVYDSDTNEQLRTGYFIYDDNGTEKWFYSADGVTAAYKSDVYIEDKFVLPGEGEMGFQKNDEGEWIYVKENGDVAKNEFVTQRGGRKFYLNNEGVLKTGWIQYGNSRYYANEHGVIQTGTQIIDGKRFVFNDDGTLLREEKENNNAGNLPTNKDNTTDSSKGTVSPTPAKPAISAPEINITNLILNPDQKTNIPGTLVTEQNVYLFPLIFSDSTLTVRDTGGTLLDGWVRYSDNWYYYDNGAMQHSWLDYDGDRYYLDPMTGIMQTGWRNIENDWYYFNANGTMQTGLAEIEGKNYYFDEDGVMQTGWVEIDGKWYYFDENGVMQIGWAEIDEKWYYFDEDGVMQTEWLTLDDKTYYLGTDGARVSGSQTIDGKEYEFDDDGVLTSSEMEK